MIARTPAPQRECQGQVHRRILITGPSGSGKTYLASALRSLGFNAVDADSIDGLCGWFDAVGNQVRYPSDADKEFLDRHAFLWVRTILVEFLCTQREVYFFGISRNVFEMLDLFDKVFFLKASTGLLLERLSNASRDNPMGRTPYQRQYCLHWAAKSEDLACRQGIEILDAGLSPDQFIAHLCSSEC